MHAFRFISDPGHGWLEVPRAEVNALGVAKSISQYSYIMGDHAYLEEDCDAAVFLEAYKAKHGALPQFNEVHMENCPIRGYARFQV